eukprot:768194-Hanusia_phi.AAC.1
MIVRSNHQSLYVTGGNFCCYNHENLEEHEYTWTAARNPIATENGDDTIRFRQGKISQSGLGICIKTRETRAFATASACVRQVSALWGEAVRSVARLKLF